MAVQTVARKRIRSTGKGSGTGSTVAVSASKAQENLSKKVARLSKIVRGIQPERKIIISNVTFSNVADTVGGINDIVALTAGTDISNRIADKVRIKSIRLTARVSTVSSSLGALPTDDEFTRFIVVQDTQTVADTIPAVSTIVQSTSTPQAPFPALDATGRFKWLAVSPLIQHARVAGSATPAATLVSLVPTQSPVWQWSWKGDLMQGYNGTAGTDIQKNALFLVCITNLAADTLDADANIRVEFIDD